MRHIEDKIQAEIVKSIRIIYPDAILYAVPNGGRRGLMEAARLKKQGVLAGVSDLHLIYKGKIVFIEVKSPAGKQEDSQKRFQENVEKNGFKYYLVRSVAEVMDIIKEM